MIKKKCSELYVTGKKILKYLLLTLSCYVR